MKEVLNFQSADKKSTVVYTVWLPQEKPVAVLQIIHGMAEHIERYDAFATYLNSFGIAVAGLDHIGHGRSAKEEDYGYFGESNGWNIMTEDEETLHHILSERFNGLPMHVMGHSMGSFIIRNWMANHGKNSGKFIIMGTAGKNPACGAGLALIKVCRLFQGGRGHNHFVAGLVGGSYNKRIPDAKSPFAWLTRDEEIVKKYEEDKACGFEFTLAGYEDLLHLLDYINKKEWYEKVVKDHPTLIVAGAEDPVGSYGEGPKEVAELMKAAGADKVELKLYEGMRHEILNEFGKEQVYEDLKNFLLA